MGTSTRSLAGRRVALQSFGGQPAPGMVGVTAWSPRTDRPTTRASDPVLPAGASRTGPGAGRRVPDGPGGDSRVDGSPRWLPARLARLPLLGDGSLEY